MVDFPNINDISADITKTKYGKFKTPVFSIEVGDVDGKNMVTLPSQLLKLVQKIEIQENLGSATCLLDTITITFLEGSREPFSKIGGKTNDLYPVETGMEDFISNKTGMLPDLIMTSNAGLTSISSLNTSLTTATSIAADALGAVAGLVSGDDTVDIDDNTDTDSVNFLFKENNQIKVTFGYAEDPEGQRSIRGRIMVIQTDFPENDHPKTTITCMDGRSDLDKLVSTKGVQFSTKFPAGVTLEGKPTVKHKDMSIIDILNKICTINGIEIIVSKTYLAEFTDKHHTKNWPAGESFHQFLSKLAARHNAYYSCMIDPKTGKDTLYFISRPDYDKYLTVYDTSLFSYKQPGSILKSVNIKADFAGSPGASVSGINDNGELVQKGHNVPASAIALFANSVLVDTNSSSSISTAVKGSAIAGKTTGKMEVSPEANSAGNINDKALSKAACGFSHMIMIEFTSLGYAKLFPGPLLITGIGKRYSGAYKIINVTHIIDENGYVCRGVGQGEALGQGGIVAKDATDIKNATQDSKSVSLFDTISSAVSGEPRKQIDAIRNKK